MFLNLFKKPTDYVPSLLFVAIVFVLFRILFTFIFSLALSVNWEVEFIWGIIPYFGYDTDFSSFAQLNSYSILATSVAMFIYFLFVSRGKLDERSEIKSVSAFFGVSMALVQFAIVWLLKDQLHFAVLTWVGIPVVIVEIMAYKILSSKLEGGKVKSEEKVDMQGF